MKKQLCILAFLMVFSLVGCTNTADTKSAEIKHPTFYENAEKSSQNKINTDLESATMPDFNVNYDNIQEMMKVSNYVLVGTVTKLEYVIVETDVYTKATLKVEKSYKGNYKKGNVVTYSKYGGITTVDKLWDVVKSHLPPDGSITFDNAKDKKVVSYMGSEDTLLEVNDVILIFADSYKDDRSKDITKDTLYPICEYQTEFHIFRDGSVQRYACENNMKNKFTDFESIIFKAN